MSTGSPWQKPAVAPRAARRAGAGRTLAPLLALALVGCTGVTTAGGQRLSIASEELRTYMEAVFREQNELLTEIAFATDAEDLSDRDRRALEAAEESLLIECAVLNDIAAARRDGRRPGWVRGSRASRRTPHCESAAADARSVLDRLHGSPAIRARAAEAGPASEGNRD
ncbi:hypothetical protein [Candidatus Rariloculus sp.]|uniref:hypothetical protein n=1 Tax=Candidatus Rariloculus sp. TaxID=3101265 RepID=UPI003D0D469C